MPNDNLNMQVQGVWQLTSRVDVDSSGKRHIDPALGADPLGMLCFSRDHFAAQFMKRDRSGEPTAVQAAQGANNSSASNGYDAYFGSYTVDQASGLLKVRLEGAITPSNIGSEFERQIQVQGNELTITLATTSAEGIPLSRTLTFARLD